MLQQQLTTSLVDQDYETARFFADVLYAHKPHDLTVRLLLAKTLVATGASASAIELLQDASDAESLFLLGKIW